MTNNGELETCDRQLLLIQHQPRLRTYLTILKVIYNTDCEKETEFEFCSVKQNTVEEFEFECSRCGKKVNLKSSIPVVKATTHPRSTGRSSELRNGSRYILEGVVQFKIYSTYL